jgi:hypothetical protein
MNRSETSRPQTLELLLAVIGCVPGHVCGERAGWHVDACLLQPAERAAGTNRRLGRHHCRQPRQLLGCFEQLRPARRRVERQ